MPGCTATPLHLIVLMNFPRAALWDGRLANDLHATSPQCDPTMRHSHLPPQFHAFADRKTSRVRLQVEGDMVCPVPQGGFVLSVNRRVFYLVSNKVWGPTARVAVGARASPSAIVCV